MKKLLVVLLVLGLAAPAMAADWNFYGSVRTHLGYYMTDQEYAGGPAMDGTIGTPGSTITADDDEGTLLSVGGQSRFGAAVKASDDLTGNVEFGFNETTRTATGGSTKSQDPYLRLLYGTWNFGAGKLMAGKNYTPGTFLGYSGMHGDIGDQGDANMLVGGLAYIGRQPQLRVSFGTFDFAVIEQNTAAATLGTMTDKDFDFPRMEAAYVFRTPVIAIRPVVGYQTYEVENATDSETIESYMAGLGVSLTLGPAYVKATASYLQNPGNYGQTNLLVLNGAGVNLTNARLIGDSVEDAELIQGTFVVGMKFSPAFGIEAGFGYGNAEVDTSDSDTAEQTGMLYYLQAPITVAKGVQIIPEIGMLDRGDLEQTGLDDIDQGTLTYVDVNFRIDF